MGANIRIVVAESPLIEEDALSSWLASRGGFEIAAARDADEALRLACEPAAAVVVLDLNSVHIDAARTIVLLKQAVPGVRVLVLSTSTERGAIGLAIGAGADGYCARLNRREDLFEAVQGLALGRTFFGPEVAEAFADPAARAPGFEIVDPTSWDLDAPARPHFDAVGQDGGPENGRNGALTQREGEILRLVATGYASQAIAARLSISVPTVRKHRENLMKKLGLHNTAEVTAFAIRRGLLSG